MNGFKRSLAIILMGIVFSGISPLFADNTSSELDMVVGDIQSVPVNGLVRISITNPDVADISDVQKDNVVMLAKNAGQTTLFIWDADGKRTVGIHISGQDLQAVRNRLIHLLKEAEIKTLNLEVDTTEGKIIITGEVPKTKKAKLERILEPLGDQFINLSKDESVDDLVQIDMQIVEVGSQFSSNMGFEWQPNAINYTESGIPTGGAKNWLKLGKFNRTTALVDTLHFLISEGKARSLSNPRLVVSSGREATINVGGEVPIQNVTTTGGGAGTSSASVSFKQYGVTLTVTPTIIEGRVDVTMQLQVSDVDPSTPIGTTGGNGVAYKTRSTQSQLMLDDQQTVVFAGLLRYNDSYTKNGVPYLSKIPVLGMLFRNNFTQVPNEAKELVVTLTPSILRKKVFTDSEITMPTKEARDYEKRVNIEQGYLREHMPSAKEMPKVSVEMLPVTAAATVNEPGIEFQDISPYIRSIQTRISRGVSYPPKALNSNWEGTVKLKLRILKDGSLANAAVIESSGHEAFDRDALNTALKAAPYDPFPPDVKRSYLNITIPIVYSQAAADTVKTQTVTPAY